MFGLSSIGVRTSVKYPLAMTLLMPPAAAPSPTFTIAPPPIYALPAGR
jgi:hypothetical protein